MATLAVLGSRPAAAGASGPPRSPGGFVLFAWWHHGREELSVVGPDGKVRLLASGNVSSAAWSPDGTRVVFARAEGESPTAPSPLFLVTSFAGGGLPEYTATTAGTQDLSPRWSPDRSTIAFVRRIQGSLARIYVVKDDGTDARPVTASSTTATEYLPQWSPSGRYLAFLRHEVDGTNIVVMDWASGEQRTVTSSGQTMNGFSWGPDDAVVYVDGDREHGDLFSVRADGTRSQRLTDDGVAKFNPVVSPNGRWVVYARHASAPINLYLLDRTTGTVRRLSHGSGRDIAPTWSPDNNFLAYVAAPPTQAPLISDQAPTRLVRLDIRHPRARPHVLVTGKTEAISISWQPSRTGYPTAGGLPYPSP